MQLVRINNTPEHREQTAQREQTQQVELRGGFLKQVESYYPYRNSVYKNPPALKVGSSDFYNFFIFFAPNNAAAKHGIMTMMAICQRKTRRYTLIVASLLC